MLLDGHAIGAIEQRLCVVDGLGQDRHSAIMPALD
jgi:hypothetical protein